MTSMKNVQFLHPLPLFSVCPNGTELGKTSKLRSWTLKLRLPTTIPPPLPPPHPLWYSCSISIILSRHFHHIPGQCNSQPFTTKNQFKLNSIFCNKTQANTSHLEYAKNKTCNHS